jgi:SAM-dependent methyltransferase
MREYLDGRGAFTGVEISEPLLEQVPDLPADTRVIPGDVMALPEQLDPESYDLCSSLAVLEHLPEPVACLEEAHRMLRPGGVFVASTPAPFWDRLAGTLGLVEDEYHQQEVTLSDMETWASEVGFETVETCPFMWCVTGFLPYLRVPISPSWSLRIDEVMRKIDPTDYSFVNQALVAQKAP